MNFKIFTIIFNSKMSISRLENLVLIERVPDGVQNKESPVVISQKKEGGKARHTFFINFALCVRASVRYS